MRNKSYDLDCHHCLWPDGADEMISRQQCIFSIMGWNLKQARSLDWWELTPLGDQEETRHELFLWP